MKEFNLAHRVCRFWRSFDPSVCLSVGPSAYLSVLEEEVFDGVCLGHRLVPDRGASSLTLSIGLSARPYALP
jgi:hypothetical protein